VSTVYVKHLIRRITVTKSTEKRVERLLRKARQNVFGEEGDYWDKVIIRCKELMHDTWEKRHYSNHPGNAYARVMWM